MATNSPYFPSSAKQTMEHKLSVEAQMEETNREVIESREIHLYGTRAVGLFLPKVSKMKRKKQDNSAHLCKKQRTEERKKEEKRRKRKRSCKREMNSLLWKK